MKVYHGLCESKQWNLKCSEINVNIFYNLTLLKDGYQHSYWIGALPFCTFHYKELHNDFNPFKNNSSMKLTLKNCLKTWIT